jgi:hypothetical protein
MLQLLLTVTLTAGGGTLVMEVGEQRVLTIPGGVQRCAMSNVASHDLKTIGNDQILVIAVAPARHTILCWNTKGERFSWEMIIHDVQRPAPERREQTGGVVELDVGRAVLLKAPDPDGCTGGDMGSYAMETWDNDHVLVRARRETSTTVVCRNPKGAEIVYALHIHEAPSRHDAPGVTELRIGEEAFIEANGIQSAASDDAKIVKVAVEDGGISVTALKLGDTDVRVKTKAGPIVHHFEVR